jgi:hypothetical protein
MTSGGWPVAPDRQRREDRGDRGGPRQRQGDLPADGVTRRQGALAEDQAAERVGGHGDGLVGGEGLQSGRHGLGGDEH